MLNRVHEGTFSQKVHEYEKQADVLQIIQAMGHETKAIHDLLIEIRENIWYANPHIKYWQETLSDVREVKLRYEGRSHLYIMVPASGIGVIVNAMGLQNSFSFNQGWNNLNYPEGSTIVLSSAGTIQPVLFRAANQPIVGGIL